MESNGSLVLFELHSLRYHTLIRVRRVLFQRFCKFFVRNSNWLLWCVLPIFFDCLKRSSKFWRCQLAWKAEFGHGRPNMNCSRLTHLNDAMLDQRNQNTRFSEKYWVLILKNVGYISDCSISYIMQFLSSINFICGLLSFNTFGCLPCQSSFKTLAALYEFLAYLKHRYQKFMIPELIVSNTDDKFPRQTWYSHTIHNFI